MNLSKQKDEILAATAVPPKEGDFVWNGIDEDDRPLSKKEMREGSYHNIVFGCGTLEIYPPEVIPKIG